MRLNNNSEKLLLILSKMNYTYICDDTYTGKTKIKSIIGVNVNKDPLSAIYLNIIRQERESAYYELFRNFNEDTNNVELVRNYLPRQYKQYANNLKKLKRHLVCSRQIKLRYKISEIQKGPLCLGCIYNASGQRDHMISPYGCLL